ncbi:fructose-bisphosphatase [Sesbania bispinosa]|nr:fructose-bisphosphatase [Sesbania bispinosa]
MKYKYLKFIEKKEREIIKDQNSYFNTIIACARRLLIGNIVLLPADSTLPFGSATEDV